MTKEMPVTVTDDNKVDDSKKAPELSDEKKETTPEQQTLLDRDKEIFELKQQLADGKKDKEAFSTLAATPEVRAVLDALDKGETVRVSVGDEAEDEPAYDPETVEDLSNVDLIKVTVKETVRALGSVMDEKLLPVATDLATLKGDKQKAQRDNTRAELNRAITKYPDFNAYAEDIIELKKVNPSLSVDELYVLARTRKGKGFPDPVRTSSEKPTSSTAASQKERKTPLPVGRKGMNQLLDEATEGETFADIIRGKGKPSGEGD